MAAKMCNVCGKRRPYTGKGDDNTQGSNLCNPCSTEGGWENTHSDYNHNAILAEVADKEGDLADYLTEHDLEEYRVGMPNCWICHPELNEATKPVRKISGVKVQGARRPQLNHKGHSHPQSPAARRACKLAFWAALKDQGVTPATVLAEHFLTWDYHCDMNGKVITDLKKPAKWHVVPEQKTEAATVKATAAAVKKAKTYPNPEAAAKAIAKSLRKKAPKSP